VTGEGVQGRVGDHIVALGNARMMGRMQVNVVSLDAEADRLRREGATVVYVMRGDKLLGLIGVADPIPSSRTRPRPWTRCAGPACES